MLDQPMLPHVVSESQLSNSFLGNLIEICFVTADYRRTMEGLVQIGMGPWRVYTFDSATVTEPTYHGRPADFGLKVCFATVGNVAVEIMQPLYGPSIVQDHLDARGEGIHHLAWDCNHVPWDERLKRFADAGFEPVQSGTFAGQNPFIFFSTEAATTTVFETYGMPAGWAWPEPEEWFPAHPPGYKSSVPERHE